MRRACLLIVFILAALGNGSLAVAGTLGKMVETWTDSLYQVFPLAPGLHYTYKYKYFKGDYADGTTTDYTIDSGLVEYAVIDSSITNSSTVSWNVVEASHINQINWTNGDPPKTSSNWSTDSVMLTISESATGLHSLSMSSGIIWGSWGSQIPVYRFSVAPYIDSSIAYYFYDTEVGKQEWKFSSTNGFYFSGSWSTSVGRTGSATEDTMELVRGPTLNVVNGKPPVPEFILQQNYPNPFNPSTVISYEMPRSAFVNLTIYDIPGRRVETLVDERENAGSHSVTFDGANLPSGVYFYRLEAGTFAETKKLMLLK